MNEIIKIETVEAPTSVKAFNPYAKSASSLDLQVSTLVDKWDGTLVEPSHPAILKKASLDPFAGDINWEERETEMLATMYENFGVGLSANQLGSLYNMFVMRHSHLGDIGVYKPRIIEVSEEEVLMEEGCLTWPMLYVKIKRPAMVKVQYFKNDGTTMVETWMDGMDARCFQHEYDHLQGTTYISLVGDLKLKRAVAKRDKFFKKMKRLKKR